MNALTLPSRVTASLSWFDKDHNRPVDTPAETLRAMRRKWGKPDSIRRFPSYNGESAGRSYHWSNLNGFDRFIITVWKQN